VKLRVLLDFSQDSNVREWREEDREKAATAKTHHHGGCIAIS